MVCIVILFIQLLSILITVNSDVVKEPCKSTDIGESSLACNRETRRKQYVYYFRRDCDYLSNQSVALPQPLDLPCSCPPGYGEKAQKNGTVTCMPCKLGEYSTGGELIGDWKKWKYSNGIPGLYYEATPYCGDFNSKFCVLWEPGDNGKHLMSGQPKPEFIGKCIPPSILMFNRFFTGDKNNNYLSFEYKVNAPSCGKISRNCGYGLYLYINKKQVLRVNTQFYWTKFVIALEQGPNEITFNFVRRCSYDRSVDYAYIKHLAMIGSDKTAKCSLCPSGSYANKTGSTECLKCKQNEYQADIGAKSCNKCSNRTFSRIGESSCRNLPPCMPEDFFVVNQPISTCERDSDGILRRNQVRRIPQWPGLDLPCTRNKTISLALPSSSRISCKCFPGEWLDSSSGNITCRRCPSGQYSNDSASTCLKCPIGHAAIPSLKLHMLADDVFKDNVVQKCSGIGCGKQTKAWENRGNHIATKRLPGTFDSTLDIKSILLNNTDTSFSFTCSLDCRMTPFGDRMAQYMHCHMKIYTYKDGKQIDSRECVRDHPPKLRNRKIGKHLIRLRDAGNYSFRFLFHHEDEANYSMLSYEARLHSLEITHYKKGVAGGCVKCKNGEVPTQNGSDCEKCLPGTYKNETMISCEKCPQGTFTDKYGSKECNRCGSGTKSNENRDGCDYNGCRYTAGPGVNFDLSPLVKNGSAMHIVNKIVYGGARFAINLCSLNHDNSSCTVDSSEYDPIQKRNVKTRKIMKTMACKVYSSSYSSSIGEIMHFKPLKENITEGLMIDLTGGYRCTRNNKNKKPEASTHILMKCDLNIGVGQPEPRTNTTDLNNVCNHELMWRTRYACPLCTSKDYLTVYSTCKDGEHQITTTRINACLSVNQKDVVILKRGCKEVALSEKAIGGMSGVIALLILILFVTLVYFIRRINSLRKRVFKPVHTFSKIVDEDTVNEKYEKKEQNA